MEREHTETFRDVSALCLGKSTYQTRVSLSSTHCNTINEQPHPPETVDCEITSRESREAKESLNIPREASQCTLKQQFGSSAGEPGTLTRSRMRRLAPPGSMPGSSAERMIPSGALLQISALQRARAPAMEQALEGILREAEVSDELIMIMRVQGVTKKAMFVSLDTTVEGFSDACSQGFGVNADSGFTDRLEL